MKNTPQNQYFPANAERMDVHCLESGCIGKYIPLGPRDFPRAGILHPSALEIALGLRPRAISRASGCKIPALGKSLGPRGMYFPIHPSSRQCTDTICLWKMEWQSFAISTSFFSALMGFCQTFFGSLCKPYFQSYKDWLRLVLRKCARLKEKTTIQTGFKGHLEISKNIKSRVTTAMHHT